MSDGDFDLADIIFDCSDPSRLALFWGEVLGRGIAGSKGPYVWWDRPPGAVGVGFQRLNEPKAEKNRVHLDLAVEDLVRAKARIERASMTWTTILPTRRLGAQAVTFARIRRTSPAHNCGVLSAAALYGFALSMVGETGDEMTVEV